MGVETFTELFTLETIDKSSKIWERVAGAVDGFTGSVDKATEAAKVSGKAIDDSLLQTASGADALTLANARLEAASIQSADAQTKLAEAERALLEAQTAARSGTLSEADASIKLTAASDNLAAAQERAAKATKAMGDAQATVNKTTDAMAAKEAEAAGVTSTLGNEGDKSGGKLSKVAATMGKVGLATGIAAGLMVKAAGDFQSSTEHLVTDAGESQAQLGRVQTGMLQIAATTGTSATDISAGMYHIESSIPPMANAAKRAQMALDEMNTAAEGAKVGGANLDTTTKALVGALTAYESKGYTSTQMMNALIATTGAGDMKLEDLAGSMANVTAQAASAGIGFEQVGGAIATMTAQGFSADRATQDLSNTIGALQKPSIQAAQEMQGLGLNVNDVSDNLGKRGLTGTLEMFTEALASHTKNGNVFIDTLKSSQVAAQNLGVAMKQLPANLQTLAKGLANGTVTASQWDAAIKGLPAGQQNLGKQFLQLTKNADSFNQLLKSGKPDAENFNAALSTLMGGSTGLNTALMLTGSHTDYFNKSVETVGKSLKSTSTDVENWDKIQGTFNQKMDVAKQTLMSAAITIGTALLPAVTKIADGITKVVTPIAHWIEGHQTLSAIILGSLAGFMTLVGVVNLGAKAFKSIKGALDSVTGAFSAVGRLLGITKDKTKELTDAQLEMGDNAGTMAQRSKASAEEMGAGWDEAAVSAEGATTATEGATVAAEENAIATDEAAVATERSGIMAAAAAVKTLAFKAAQVAVKVATEAWTAAQWLLNAAFLDNPIGIVIAAILALAAGFYYLWNHSAGFRDFWKGLWKDIKDITVDVWHFIDGLIHDVVDYFVSQWHRLQNDTENVWHALQMIVHDTVETIKGIVNWFGSLPGKFEQWMTGARDAVVNKVKDILLWFANLQLKILDYVKDAGTWLIHVGEDIIKGLASGIDNMVGWLENKVKGIGSAIVGGLKSMLHIGSPSKLLADEVGKWIPAGIAVGIEDNMGPLTLAAHGAGQAAVGAAQGGFSAPVTSPSGGGGGGVYVDLRGSQMMTERDMDTLVNKIGRALAVRVLPSGGLRVAM